ncbi:MAG: Structural maintenance of chromosomes protein 3 [Trizodia sp. TS-e1964]|nr:MAG: Structural maintenance of chromosomes protein 3 [Trizodia sp. TS-e1964]
MGREERQALLHEGSGSAVMSAYVEIIFDNSDERFPTGKDELILRRTIGLKKDEYSLDRKNATKADVMNLLESAGFSRSNPYYIVPQGRVTTLTNMKDPERLTLLKEVAGTQVYEARRTESLRIMTDTLNKRSKIDELLDYIKDRLSELEEEKEELRNYQEKDRERRSLEYTIYHREQVEIANALDSIDELRQHGVYDNDDSRERYLRSEQEIATLTTQIADFKQQTEQLRLEKKQLEAERKDTARSRAKVELDIKSLTEGQSRAQELKYQHDSDLADVQNAIQERNDELSTILPEYNMRKDKENKIKAQLDEAESIRQRLYAKQGRNSQFKSKKQRDDWLRREVDEVNVALAKRKAIFMEVSEEIQELQANINTLETEMAQLRESFDSRGDSMQTISQEVQQAKDERDRLIDQRKELWREEAKLEATIGNVKQQLEQAERKLSHTMDQNTSRGLAAVRRIKNQFNLEGVYGTMAELMEVSEKYRTAVEVTAGNSLFHYIVDNDATATKVLEILQSERSGRVTFMPLNRLNPQPANLPKANDVVAMMDKIKFDPVYKKAFQQVFGKTIICPNLGVAGQYARSHGVSAITPEGDRSDKRGALSGGYYDNKNSRLEAVKTVGKWRDEYEEHKDHSLQLRSQVEAMDQQITRAVGELQKVEQKRQRLEGLYGPLKLDLRSKSAQLEKQKDNLVAKIRSKENVEASLKALGEQMTSYQAELSSEFKKALSPDEEHQLESLSLLIQDLGKKVSDLSKSRSELEAQKSMIEVELRENLYQRLDQLTSLDMENAESIGSQSNLKDSQRELKSISKAYQILENRLREIETTIDDLEGKLAVAERNKAEKTLAQEETSRSIERQQKKIEKSMAKKSLLTEKAAQCARDIRDLGVLPEEAFERFKNTPSNTIVKRLHKVHESLKGFSHINKKAFEQYTSFTKQRVVLTERRQELDSSQTSIEQLIEVLDHRKDEAIERTFKQVSKEFAKIFEKLVPAGRGRLVIQRKTDKSGANRDVDDSEDEATNRHESVESYTGVGISVSFNSKHDEQQRIQQLSGGQKSLCALALVFAIQQCDPAPFYLFDEIDANLDAQYRTAVASMLQSVAESSENGQFICTTFRPEMVHVADKCYGVAYANKTSSIDVVRREEALSFVDGQKP